jgi:hypothetical protein
LVARHVERQGVNSPLVELENFIERFHMSGFHIPDKYFILFFFFLSRHGPPDPFGWCPVSSAWPTREVNPSLNSVSF